MPTSLFLVPLCSQHPQALPWGLYTLQRPGVALTTSWTLAKVQADAHWPQEVTYTPSDGMGHFSPYRIPSWDSPT